MTETGERPGATEVLGRDLSLLLPPGWVRLATSPPPDAEVTRLVNRRFMQLPEGLRMLARRLLRTDLLDQVDRAARQGAMSVLLCVDPVRGVPLAASGALALAPLPDFGQDLDPVDLLTLYVEGEDLEHVQLRVTPLAGGIALRRQERRLAVPAEELGNPIPSTHVEYVVPVPDRPSVLLLSFSTTSDEAAEPLVALFDAIAGTLRWTS